MQSNNLYQQEELWDKVLKHFDNQELLHSVLRQKSVLFCLKNENKFIHEYSNACGYPIVLVTLVPYMENNKIYLTNQHEIYIGEFLKDAGYATHWVMISHDLSQQVPVKFDTWRPILANSTLIVKPYDLVIDPLSLLQ